MMDSKKKPAKKGPLRKTAEPRKQERGLLTRREIVEAARRIFARDGFDLARLEDIASAAGKTRGAFYAHFKDKEDVFFAIFEEDIVRDKQRMAQRLEQAGTAEERRAALAEHLLSVVRDRDRMLLDLEFKLYAIRTPRRHRRLADLHAAMCLRGGDVDVEGLLPEWTCTSPEQKRRKSAEIGAMLDGLALNGMFAPNGIDDGRMLEHLKAGIGLVLE